MLYDPKWEKPAEQKVADPMSLASLIAWLERQPARKTYNYICNGHCLLAQYFTAMGYQNIVMLSRQFIHGRDTLVDLPPHFNSIAINEPRTFGGALRRARKFAA